MVIVCAVPTKPSRPERIRRLVSHDARSRARETSRSRVLNMNSLRILDLGRKLDANIGVSRKGGHASAALSTTTSLTGVEPEVAVSPVFLMISVHGRLFKWISAGPEFIRLAVSRTERLPPPFTKSAPPGLACMRLARCRSGREPGHCAARAGNSRRQAEMVASRPRRENPARYSSPTSGRTVSRRSPS